MKKNATRRCTTFEILFQYRFIISAVLFLLVVIFELHGSSISIWENYLSEASNRHTLFGTPRQIRSDEWAVSTPMALSQYHNVSGAFAYFSDTLRGTSTDAFIVYGQPVLDIAVIFRPFHWGYLFLSAGRGLSFFWMGRLIALFLVTLQLGLLITKQNRYLSVALAALITFSPIVQWWFAVNGIVEMFVFGELGVLLIYNYMKTDSIKRKILFAIIFAICAGGYVLTFYPAWQIPLFYVFFALAIWVIIDNYKKGMFSLRDIAPLSVFLIIFVGGMAYILIKSYPTIQTVMNTVYPGSRLETGGDAKMDYFHYLGNIFLPFAPTENLPDNQCEMAVFFDLFPSGLILSAIIIFKQKVKDKLLVVLFLVCLLLSLWCLFPWPKWLAKVTLLSNSPAHRTFVAVGFVNILMLIRAMALYKTTLGMGPAAIISGIFTVIIVFLTKVIYGTYYNNFFLVISSVIIFIFVMIVLLCKNNKVQKLFCFMSVMISLISGFAVNPIEKGVGALMEQPIVQQIKDIADQDDGLWIVEGMGLPLINLPIVTGAPTINSTNTYPALERWRLLDENGEYEHIYNQYAHIIINLQNERKTTFMNAGDVITLSLNVENLQTLDVKYVFTANDFTALNSDEVNFKYVNGTQNHKIYEVVYTKE